MRTCPVSGSQTWIPFYTSKTNRIMTGDQRIREGNLQKIICPHSGVVANERAFTPDELEVFYGEDYELNSLGREEHFFYTTDGPEARSKVFFDWIEPHLPDKFNTLIEIGCGEGNLLARFAKRFPGKNVLGFDGSRKAAELAREKGLRVQQKLILGNEPLPNADVFILINVIEHVEDITRLVSIAKNALKEDGRIIFCLPVQDYGGYDIFFAEHVWHFTSEHFTAILGRNGLRPVYTDINHPINHGIGLFVCEPIQNNEDINTSFSEIIKRNLEYWENSFNRLDEIFRSRSFDRVAVFGAGEIFSLFFTFTSLYKQNVIACIDDTKKPGEEKHGIAIYNSEWLKNNSVDLLLLTVNRKYEQMIRNRFRDTNINIQSIIY